MYVLISVEVSGCPHVCPDKCGGVRVSSFLTNIVPL